MFVLAPTLNRKLERYIVVNILINVEEEKKKKTRRLFKLMNENDIKKSY